jgi:hypothetical protein
MRMKIQQSIIKVTKIKVKVIINIKSNYCFNNNNNNIYNSNNNKIFNKYNKIILFNFNNNNNIKLIVKKMISKISLKINTINIKSILTIKDLIFLIILKGIITLMFIVIIILKIIVMEIYPLQINIPISLILSDSINKMNKEFNNKLKKMMTYYLLLEKLTLILIIKNPIYNQL